MEHNVIVIVRLNFEKYNYCKFQEISGEFIKFQEFPGTFQEQISFSGVSRKFKERTDPEE